MDVHRCEVRAEESVWTRYASDEPLRVSVEEQYARHSHRAIRIRRLDVRAHTLPAGHASRGFLT
jgi:hypothetical protein